MHLANTRPRGCACEQYKTVAPVGDRVLVKVDVSEAKSTGGILLPTSAQKKPTQGEITSVGSAKAVKACTLGLLAAAALPLAPLCSTCTAAFVPITVHACVPFGICLARMR